MAKLYDRVKMTVSGTPGTGTVTLGSASAGFQSFAQAGVANGDLVSYAIEDGSAWEYGLGTYTSSGTTFARTTVQKSFDGVSTYGTSAISLTSSATVAIVPLAADILNPANNLSELASASTARTNLGIVPNQSFTSVSTNTTLVSGSAYRITGGTSITLTLPVSPASGDTIRIVDGGIITPLNIPTIARNGATIMGVAADTTLDVQGVDFLIWYNGSDWRIF